MQDNTVSVIIPAYNRRELTMEAVASVRAQTLKPLECIVVDDGSTDDTALAIAESYPDVRVLKQQHCGYPGKVRNAGARLASGHWLAFLDSDDLWLSQKLELQTAEINRYGTECVLLHTREIWKRFGRVVSQRGQSHQHQGWIFEDALKKCIIGPSTVLIRRDLYLESGGFREDLEIAEDYEFWLRLVDRHQVHYLDVPLVEKREGGWEQLSAKYGQIEIFRIAALERLVLERSFGTEQHFLAAVQELDAKYRVYARGCKKRGREAESLEYFARADHLSDLV